MKNTFLPLLFALLLGGSAQAQSCLPNGIEFSTQAQINNFPTNYPGCTSIGGDVRISGNITNLNGLAAITTIEGSLTLYNCPLLTNVNGLGNLRTAKSINIFSLDALANLSGLGLLTEVKSWMGIYNLKGLVSLEGLGNLVSVGDVFMVSLNPALESLNGLDKLTSVGGRLAVTDLPKLKGLEGLSQLTTVGGDCELYGLPLLKNLNGLGNLTSIAGNFSLSNMPALPNLDGLDRLTAIGGTLNVAENPQLARLGDFKALTSLGGIYLSNNPVLSEVNGLEKIRTIEGGGISFYGNPVLSNLDGLQNITTVGGSVQLSGSPLLTHLDSWNQLTTVSGDLNITDMPNLASLTGLSKVVSANGLRIVRSGVTNLNGLEKLMGLGNGGLQLEDNPKLGSLDGLQNMDTLGGTLSIASCPLVNRLAVLDKVTAVGGGVYLSNLPQLTHLYGLEQVAAINGDLSISGLPLTNLDELAKLLSVSGGIRLSDMPQLTNLAALHNITRLEGQLEIANNPALTSLSGLQNIAFARGGLLVNNNDALTSLAGLDNLEILGYNQAFDSTAVFQIQGNAKLTSLAGLEKLTAIGNYVTIQNNPLLSDCAIFVLCNAVFNNPPQYFTLGNNAPGCSTPTDIKVGCGGKPVTAEVLLDNNGNALPDDPTDLPLENIRVSLSGTVQMNLAPTDAMGFARFLFLGNGAFTFALPQASGGRWAISEFRKTLVSSNGRDSTHVQLLLTPLVPCPELTVSLGMPSTFRGCLVHSDISVAVQNTGAALAEGVKLAIVLPTVLEVLSTVPLLSGQKGDTLYLELGDLKPFETATARLSVKTKCDTFLLAQTLCVETFAALDNACPRTAIAFSRIKLSAKCLNGNTVRFTLKNIGDAPTQGPHAYRIFRNEIAGDPVAFSLANQQSMTVDLPADGATYRMEATKSDNGALTATALENCGGLTPGLITAFWLEKGGLDYDFDCRQVVAAFDPNLKSAVPTGFGPDHRVATNRPFQYTIDFQNTGTDTAYRVLLRDVLPPKLDSRSFRPLTASHPCQWSIRGRDTLEVLFSPIALPDSNVNEPASHGFFVFEINQKPDLPVGTTFANKASIVFDFNPPIITNTVRHSIGALLVEVAEPGDTPVLWQVLGNPARQTATFLTKTSIPGEKRWTLVDASGQMVRQVRFSGQSFVFQRDGLPAGVYFFNIEDGVGGVFSGKIVVID